MTASALLRDLTPPALQRILRRLRPAAAGLAGRYPTWRAAVALGTGYDDAEILERVTRAALQVTRGEAACDRDGVAFDEPQWPFALIAAVLRAATASSGTLRVLDFGGALGSSYRQCRPFLKHLHGLRWCVVEQTAFVERGRAQFETAELCFCEHIAECIESKPPGVVLLSGVLQYLDDPYGVLKQVKETAAPLIVVDRTPWADASEDIITLQVVAAEIFPARLPFRVFSRGQLERCLAPEYRTAARFPALDADMWLDSQRVAFGGWLFERIVS